MSYQDGLGTWVWNEDIERIVISFADNTYDFNFESAGKSYNAVYFYVASPLDYEMRYLDGTITPSHFDTAYSVDGWSATYKTINITSPPPADFLTILQNNAEYQEPTVTTYKLTINGKRATINGKSKGTLTFGGKTYQWDNSTPAPTDELLGTWAFNEKLTGADIVAGVSFSVGRDNYIYISWVSTSASLSYGEEEDVTPVYLGYWYAASDRTIIITDTSTLTNRDEFTAWLKANANKQEFPDNPGGFTPMN